MTNGTPPRRPPPLTPPPLDKVRPIEERFAPPPGQRKVQQADTAQTGARHPGTTLHADPDRHQRQEPYWQPSPQAHAGKPHPGHQGRRSAPKRRSAIARVLLGTVVIMALTIAAGATYILLAPPTDLIRERAVSLVKARTGRDLTIAGPARLTLYPSATVTLKDVALSAPPGMDGAPTVAMESLDISVKLLPLLSRRVEIKKLALTRPRFDFRVDKNGRKSWDMAAADILTPALQYAERLSATTRTDAPPTGAARLAQTGEPATQNAGGQGRKHANLDDLVLRDVRIVDGILDYRDDRTGVSQSATAINVGLRARNLSSPVAAKGDLVWQGQAIRFDGSLNTLAEVLSDAPAKLSLNVAAQPLKAEYSGAIDLRNGTTLDGTISAQTESVRALAQWLGKQLPSNEGFGALSVAGRLKTRPGAFQLVNADLTLDQIHATGELSGSTTSARPLITADLKVSAINLNTYVGEAARSDKSRAAPPNSAAPSPSGSPSSDAAPKPQTIEDLLERQSGPQVKGYTARAGWSETPIDTVLLGLVDADAKLSLGQLIVRDVKIGQSDVVLALRNGVAKANFDRVDIYGGTGRGQVTIDASTAEPAFAASIVVDGVSAEPLLQDAASVDWLSGKGKLTIATSSRGATQKALVSALNGKMSLNLNDGAIRGFDVTKVLRGLQRGQLSGLSPAPSEKTEFSQLSATFDIVNGIATNQDLVVTNPMLRVTGDGRVMMPDRQVDYTFHPKLASNPSSQPGATSALAGLQVPIRITGAWDRPQITPDLSKVDTKQAVQAVEELGKRLKGKNSDEVVDELLGKDTKEGQKAKKFLDKLFR